jgi:hypothetical protein
MGDATLGLEQRLSILDRRNALGYGWPQLLVALVKSDLWIRRNSCP